MTPTLAPSGSNLLFQAFTGSLWLLLDLCDSHSGSNWLSLPLSGILWPSLAHYCSQISHIQPLIGSQGPCSALIADARMTHFLPLWSRGARLVVFTGFDAAPTDRITSRDDSGLHFGSSYLRGITRSGHL